MKPLTALSPLVAFALALCVMSCRNEVRIDATQPLKESFQAAELDVKQAIDTVNASLKAGDYNEATRALVPVVASRHMTEAEKQAVGLALRQINQAIARNPSLDTREMYELRAKMFHAVHSGPGF